MPSTFANIKSLYASPKKLEVLKNLVEGYAADPAGLKDDKQTNGSSSSRFEQAVYYFLAQHYDYYQSRDLKKAMEYTEKAIALDPKSVFFTMTKARIYKHQGDLAWGHNFSPRRGSSSVSDL